VGLAAAATASANWLLSIVLESLVDRITGLSLSRNSSSTKETFFQDKWDVFVIVDVLEDSTMCFLVGFVVFLVIFIPA
jgi:hypothetical protein